MNATERAQARLPGEEVMRLRAELVALRRRAERTEMDLQNMEIAQADARERVALLEGLLRDLAAKGEAMKEALFTGNDTEEAIACMEWDDAVGTAPADGG